MDSERFEGFWRQWAFYLIVAITLIAFDSLGVFNRVRTTFEEVTMPVERMGKIVVTTLYKPVEMVTFYRHGVSRIADLEARLAEQMVDQTKFAQLEAENQEMRRLLGAPLPPAWKFLPAKVLGENRDSLVIGAGSKAGVATGMTVTSEQIFIGVVEQVSEAKATVRLARHYDSKIAAVFKGTKTSGIVTGQEGLLVMDQILQGAKVEAGSIVVSAGSDQVVPNLVIGRVTEVISKPSDVYQKARLERAVNIEELTTVFVITGVE